MRRQWTVHEVHGTLDGGLIDATFDERLTDDAAPDLWRRAVVTDHDGPYGIALAAWVEQGNMLPPAPAPEKNDVKAEAARRIEAIMPDYKQRNVLAFGLETVMTYGADPSQWPEPLQQVNAEMQAKWETIKAIRVRSDEIEVMDPIPADFRDDSYW
jgi:hypothetical protein